MPAMSVNDQAARRRPTPTHLFIQQRILSLAGRRLGRRAGRRRRAAAAQHAHGRRHGRLRGQQQIALRVRGRSAHGRRTLLHQLEPGALRKKQQSKADGHSKVCRQGAGLLPLQ
jgi:hypothetical protein